MKINNNGSERIIYPENVWPPVYVYGTDSIAINFISLPKGEPMAITEDDIKIFWDGSKLEVTVYPTPKEVGEELVDNPFTYDFYLIGCKPKRAVLKNELLEITLESTPKKQKILRVSKPKAGEKLRIEFRESTQIWRQRRALLRDKD